MSERDASYYQEHKDDAEEWEEAPPPSHAATRPRRRLDAIVSVRFSPAEQDLLRAAASRRGETLSTFVRSAALRATYQPLVVTTTAAPLENVHVLGDPGVVVSRSPLPQVRGLILAR